MSEAVRPAMTCSFVREFALWRDTGASEVSKRVDVEDIRKDQVTERKEQRFGV